MESKPSQRRAPRETATDRLVRAYREGGDPRARDRVVQIYLPLVDTFARRYERAGVGYDELMRAGSAALTEAIESYVPRRGEEFIGFGVPMIVEGMKLLTAGRGAAVATDFDLRDERLQLAGAFRALEPTEREILQMRFVDELNAADSASRLGMTPDQLARQTRATLARLRRKLERLGSGRSQTVTDIDASDRAVDQASPARDVTVSHSGRLLLRMPPSLHTNLAGAAQREKVSLNRFITRALAAKVSWGENNGTAGGAPSARPAPRWLPAAIAVNIAIGAIAGIVGLILLLGA